MKTSVLLGLQPQRFPNTGTKGRTEQWKHFNGCPKNIKIALNLLKTQSHELFQHQISKCLFGTRS